MPKREPGGRFPGVLPLFGVSVVVIVVGGFCAVDVAGLVSNCRDSSVSCGPPVATGAGVWLAAAAGWAALMWLIRRRGDRGPYAVGLAVLTLCFLIPLPIAYPKGQANPAVTPLRVAARADVALLCGALLVGLLVLAFSPWGGLRARAARSPAGRRAASPPRIGQAGPAAGYAALANRRPSRRVASTAAAADAARDDAADTAAAIVADAAIDAAAGAAADAVVETTADAAPNRSSQQRVEVHDVRPSPPGLPHNGTS